MTSLKGQGDVALGLFVDGLNLKLAHLSRTGKRLVLHDLKESTLVRRLEEQQAMEGAIAFGGEGEDAFNLASTVPESTFDDRGADSNNSVVLGLLSEYPPRKYMLAYSLSEPQVYYHTMESDGGLKGDKLKSRIIEDIQNLRTVRPGKEAVNYLKTEENTILAVVREDGLQLVNIFEDIKSFIGGRIPRTHSICSADIALMNAIRYNYDFMDDEISIVIYIGLEFSRIIFMRGNHYLHFAPIIGEGSESPMLQNTLYSRILLEQDNLALPAIHRIILSGHCQDIDLKTMLGPQFADIELEPIRYTNIDTSNYYAEGDIEAHLAEYAIAIGTAIGVLEDKNRTLYHLDLLPKSIHEKQNAFQFKWHGWLIMLLLFLTALFFTIRIIDQLKFHRSQKDTITSKERQLTENQRLQMQIDSIQTQIGRYSTSLAVFDTLVPGSDRCSKILAHVGNGLEDLSSTWITSIRTTPTNGIVIDGYSVYRARVPRVATMFDGAVLRRVTTSKIRDKIVYEFQIEVDQPVKR